MSCVWLPLQTLAQGSSQGLGDQTGQDCEQLVIGDHREQVRSSWGDSFRGYRRLCPPRGFATGLLEVFEDATRPVARLIGEVDADGGCRASLGLRQLRGDGDDLFHFVVLDELGGDRRLVISVGDAEAFALGAVLQGLRWGRPMTCQFTAALVRSLGGRVREVRLDRVVAGAYAATVEVEGPPGAALVDARSSDVLNLAVLTHAPVCVAPEVLADCIGRREGDSTEAALLQCAITASPMTVRRADR